MRKLKQFIKNIRWLLNNDLSEKERRIVNGKDAVRVIKRTTRELNK